jgi:soluble lytic murein transglycosylase
MEEEDQAYDRAIQWYAQAMREPQVTPQFQARVAWSLAWSLGRLNRHADAALTLASNIDATGNGFERARFQFWLARFYQKSNLDDKALELFRELRDQDFLGYYGLMARRELRESLPPITELRAPASVLTANFTEIRRYLNPEIALWLAAVGESQVAKEYLDLAARSMNKAKELGLEAWLDLLRIYAQAGEYQSLIDHLGQIDFNLRQAIVRRSPELVFPTPFELVVHKSAEKFGVARELIFSIMRQESAFNPRARSHADAFGLMQVLPEVARATRPQHGIAFEKDDDLYNPDINVPIGANHLRDLRGRHRDQFILYVTSYNASEKAIAGWLKTRFREDALEFIEDIPYDETRSYVRLVMRNFVFYSMLSRPGAAMPFPEDLLRLTATVD